jgi:hypothetical protein
VLTVGAEQRHDDHGTEFREGRIMSNSRKWILAAVAASTSAALLVGGASAALAYDRGDRGSSMSGSASSESMNRGPLSSLVADGTLTAAQATAIHAALHAQRDTAHADHEAHEAEMKKVRDAVLASLVSKGTLTQAKADAIKAADRGELRELLADGTVTMADLQAVRDALETERDADRADHVAEMKAARATVLSGLVTKGTLTQAQADKVTAALDAKSADGTGRGGHGGPGGGHRR